MSHTRLALALLLLLSVPNSVQAGSREDDYYRDDYRAECYRRGQNYYWNGYRCVKARSWGRGPQSDDKNCPPGTRYVCGVPGCWCQ